MSIFILITGTSYNTFHSERAVWFQGKKRDSGKRENTFQQKSVNAHRESPKATALFLISKIVDFVRFLSGSMSQENRSVYNFGKCASW